MVLAGDTDRSVCFFAGSGVDMAGFKRQWFLCLVAGVFLASCLQAKADELQICKPCELLNSRELPAAERVQFDALRIMMDSVIAGKPVLG